SARYVQEYLSNFLNETPMPGIEYENTFYKKNLSAITLAEVNALSPKRMNGSSRVITISSQLKETTSALPAEADVRAIIEKVSGEQLAAYDDKTSNKPLLSSKPVPGKITAENKIP